MRLRLAAPVAALAVAAAVVPATAAPQSPRDWATQAVGVTSIRWEQVRTSLIGTHVRGREYRGGVAVDGTYALVSKVDGRVVQAVVRTSPLPGAPVAHPVGTVAARTTALARLHVTQLLAPAHVDHLLVPRAGRLVDTYEVTVLSRTARSRVDVDAATGRVLDVVDPGKHDTGTAHVFDPNPVVTSRSTALRPPSDVAPGVPGTSPVLTAQLRSVPVTFTSTLPNLSGDWADLLFPVGYTGDDFSFSRSDPRFVGLMAYAHVDRYQRWLRSLGLTDVNAEPQKLVALTAGDDNSAYYPGEDVIIWQGGGVPDAEDAEVVLHEYGHAVQDDQVPGYGRTHEGGSMGEGFGDFDAANYYALTSGGFGDLCVAEWDSTAYSTSNPPCLRRMDSTKTWDPKHPSSDVHVDGELWSAFLWRLRSHLGSDARTRSTNAIRLVLTSHELETPDATFASSVAALRTAANALHHPDWATWVTREARTSGFAA